MRISVCWNVHRILLALTISLATTGEGGAGRARARGGTFTLALAPTFDSTLASRATTSKAAAAAAATTRTSTRIAISTRFPIPTRTRIATAIAAMDRRSAIECGCASLLVAQQQLPSGTPFPSREAAARSHVNPDANANANSNSNPYPPLTVVTDPNTYSALAYAPPGANTNTDADTNADTDTKPPPPLVLVLHGAAINGRGILEDLADPFGEHAGLIPSLIAGHTAPTNLLEGCCVLAPYATRSSSSSSGSGTATFYGEPRRKLLDFCDWAIQQQQQQDQQRGEFPLRFDPDRIYLLGFSDGATVAVELLTTRRFAAGVVCSYGYTGRTLPPRALERLKGIPVWVFHSRDDVIFDVGNSDRLVEQLERTNANGNANSVEDLANSNGHTTTVGAGASMASAGSQSSSLSTTMVKGLSTTTNKSLSLPLPLSTPSSSSSSSSSSIVRYSRYDTDPEHLPPRVRGHSMGITASKSPEVYDWLLRQGPLLPMS